MSRASEIKKAADIIRSGGIVCFPTSSLYGLGASVKRDDAIKRIYEIKGRPKSKPILILVENRQDIESYVKSIPAPARKLMDRFWPGGLTIIFEASKRVPERLTAGTGKIAIRQVKHPVAAELIARAGMPITGTSANLSGEPGCRSVSELPARILESVDFLLDDGILAGGRGSTVLDATVDPPVVVRRGKSIPPIII